MPVFVGQILLAVLNLVSSKLGEGWKVRTDGDTLDGDNSKTAFLQLSNPLSVTTLRIDSEEYGRTTRKERLRVRGFIGGLLSDSNVELDPNSKPVTLAKAILEFLPVLEAERALSEKTNIIQNEIFTALADRGAVFGENGIEIGGNTLQVSAEGHITIATGNLTLDQAIQVLDLLK